MAKEPQENLELGSIVYIVMLYYYFKPAYEYCRIMHKHNCVNIFETKVFFKRNEMHESKN